MSTVRLAGHTIHVWQLIAAIVGVRAVAAGVVYAATGDTMLSGVALLG